MTDLERVRTACEEMASEIQRERELADQLATALKRVMPMVIAAPEDYSDINGNEDTRTAAGKNAKAALAQHVAVRSGK